VNAKEQYLWAAWTEEKSPSARAALINFYSPWARLVARDVYLRVAGLGEIWRDCSQNAMVGLMEAIDRYELGRSAKFETYARHRVRGAVFNGLRNLHERARSQVPFDALAAERIESLFESGGDPLESFADVTGMLGLAALIEARSVPSGNTTDPAFYALQVSERSEAVAALMDELPERDRSILTMHYYHHVPFIEIALNLGITKGRVSQLHKRALEFIRVGLKKKWSDLEL
jgi:RNA polymerase sigma factor for flagellar operon FliA